MRRFMGAALVVMVIGGFILADTVTGLVTSVKGGKDGEIKVLVKEKGKKKGEEKSFKVTEKTEFVKKTKDSEDKTTAEAITEAIEKSKGKVKGVLASIEVTDGTATKVTVKAGGKKKKDK